MCTHYLLTLVIILGINLDIPLLKFATLFYLRKKNTAIAIIKLLSSSCVNKCFIQYADSFIFLTIFFIEYWRTTYNTYQKFIMANFKLNFHKMLPWIDYNQKFLKIEFQKDFICQFIKRWIFVKYFESVEKCFKIYIWRINFLSNLRFMGGGRLISWK